MEWLSNVRAILRRERPKKPVLQTWKYAFFIRFPVFLKTKWGQRFCERYVRELDLKKAVKRNDEIRKLIWEPFLTELRHRKELRALVTQTIEQGIEDFLKGLDVKLDANKPSDDGDKKEADKPTNTANQLPEKDDGKSPKEDATSANVV